KIVTVVDDVAPIDPPIAIEDMPQEPPVEFAKDFDFAKYVLSTSTVVNSANAYANYSLPKDFYKNIVWRGYRADMPSLNLLKAEADSLELAKIAESGNYISYEDLGGRFTYLDKPGAIIFAGLSCGMMDCASVSPNKEFFVLYDGKIILLALNSQIEAVDYKTLFQPSINIDKTSSLHLIEFPKYLYGSNLRQKLVYYSEGSVQSYNFSNKKEVVFTDKVVGDVYSDMQIVDSNDNGYYVYSPDGRVGYYSYEPDFIGKNVVLSGGGNLKDYQLMSAGCGRSRLNLVNDKLFDIEKDLQVVGKNSFGDKVYELTDKNNKVYHDFYNSTYYPSPDGKVSYEKFIADKPIYLWQSPFGYWVALKSDKYQPMAECGKPVIYLYPTKTTNVKVQVELSKWSVSEPAYNNGWEVVAEPNGKLTEVKSGNVYPYLFWEGQGVGSVADNRDGFVVKREEVSKFLREKLLMLGLNEKESADFREFWESHMTKAPYYFVTFYGTNAMNTIAPLKINPKPDTVIRILMDYKPLLKPIVVKEQSLRSVPRTGFTVIEWGGVLGRE
ncbi:MAG: hypothetical protein US58_C0039G0001, partial [Candidatus Magasanikbacteria bacterium GW2011_GWA2_37_8]